MKDKYCLPIIASDMAEIRQLIEGNEQNYGYFEIWLDYIDVLDEQELFKIIENYASRIVLVFRRQKLEEITMPLPRRLELLEKLGDKECLIDLAIPQQIEELEYVKNNGLNLKTIISFHDYDKTPGDEELDSLIKKMNDYSAYIVKVATFCNEETDALRLLELQVRLKKQGRKHIILGMGEAGKITRVYGTLWGNALAFVPNTMDKASDPGQFTLKNFDNIIKTLQGNN